MDVAIATCTKYPNLGQDGASLLAACAKIGLDARPVIWDDPTFDWSSPKLCLLHSTWDYQHRRAEFLEWAERVSSLTTLWNPAPLVRQNTHKGYLRDLTVQGIPTIPTVWLPPGAITSLSDIRAEKGWQTIVIKPAVSASAFGTLLVTANGLEHGQAHLEELLKRGEALVQPYYDSLGTYGERCLVFIDGEFTHVARRPSTLSETEGRIAGEVHLTEPIADEIELTKKVLALVQYSWLYARVDLVRDEQGEIHLMELEMTEPGMFFRFAPHAAERLAHALQRLCRHL